jgi:hypothetical protein
MTHSPQNALRHCPGLVDASHVGEDDIYGVWQDITILKLDIMAFVSM